MSLKVKLTSTIVAFMLILGLTIMGVFAAPTATIQLGGSLNFKATDVHAKVTGVIAGTKVDPQPTLTDLVFESGVNTDVSSWANVPLEFTDTGSEITITVTIENLATDRPLYAFVNDAVGSVENVTKSMKKGSDAYTGDLIELPASTGTGTSTAVITLSMKVTDPNASIADDATYGYTIQLDNEVSTEILDYNYDDENLTASVKMIDATTTSGDIVVPSTVVKDEKTYTVTSVADYGFTDQTTILTALADPENADMEVLQAVGAKVTSVVLPETITHIGVGAFAAVMSLTNINIPANLETMGDLAFVLTVSLDSVEFNCFPQITDILSSTPSTFYMSGVKNVKIKSGDVAFGTFSDATSLQKVELCDGVTSIGGAAFAYCSSLSNITIPNSVTSIGYGAFGYCSSLSNITIPNSVTSIGERAFEGCTVLKNVVMKSITPITLGASTFSNVPASTLVITVPKGCLSAYETAENWSALKTSGVKFVEASE